MSGEVIYVDFANRVSRKVQTSPTKPVDSKLVGKAQVFATMIGDGKTRIGFDARRKGVLLPEHLKVLPVVHLDWSHGFGLSDFEYDNDGVRGTLSFNREPFYTIVPWEAVWEISNPKSKPSSRVWPESLPPEMLQQNPWLRVAKSETTSAPMPAPEESHDRRRKSEVDVKDSQRLEATDAEGLCFKLGQAIGRKIKGRFSRWL